MVQTEIWQKRKNAGRIVNYVRNTMGRITQVRTKKTAADTVWTVLLNSIIRQPMTNLVQSCTFGNGLNDWNTFTLDYELDVLGVYNGATAVINRAHTRTVSIR